MELTASQPHPPLTAVRARVDEKGRLKLSVDFARYLMATTDARDVRVFVTIQGDIARIYPLQVWKHNEEVLERLLQEEPEEGERLNQIVRHYGGDPVMDESNRILLPEALRNELKLKDAWVWLEYRNGGINVTEDSVYQERLAQAKASYRETLGKAKRMGFV